jgi:DNA-binding transcriptional MerR regulator
MEASMAGNGVANNGKSDDDGRAGAAFEGYRGPAVCKIVGITYRQLDYWARTHLIRPSIADARGSGSQRRYSYRDLVELKVIKSLLDAGVSLQSARVAIEYLRTHLDGDLSSAKLVLNGPASVLVRNDGELVDLMRRGQGVFSIVALDGVTEELNGAIRELRPPAEPGAEDAGLGGPKAAAANHPARAHGTRGS